MILNWKIYMYTAHIWKMYSAVLIKFVNLINQKECEYVYDYFVWIFTRRVFVTENAIVD